MNAHADIEKMSRLFSFALVVSSNSIFFWPDIPRAIKEMYRVLKSEGIIFCGGGSGSREISLESTADRIV
jgi:ubiquinone/menaquinone biosynthesis C-methylase UbiE